MNRTSYIYILRYLAALLVGVAMLGCGKIDLEGDTHKESVPVTFSTYASRATKADGSFVAPGITQFAAGAQIGVYGFYHNGNSNTDGSWAADGASNTPDFMYNQAVSKQSDASWAYSPIKYWPNETRTDGNGATSAHADKLSFWGYYPHTTHTEDGAAMYTGTDAVLQFLQSGSTSVPYANTTSGLPAVTFTQSTDPEKMVDLMFASPIKDLTKPSLDGNVLLNFRHALTLVEFRLKEDAEVRIKGISISQLKKSGTCTDPTAAPLSWSVPDTPANLFTYAPVITEPLAVDRDEPLVAFILVPQEIRADATIDITYDIFFASQEPYADPIADAIIYSDNHAEKRLYKTGAGGYGVTSWEPGHRYIYYIQAGLDRIEFTATVVEEWDLDETTELSN